MRDRKPKLRLKPVFRKLSGLIIKTAILIVVFYLLFQYVFGIHYLRGNYMFPALKDGDLVMTYKLEEAVKNDVVMYEMNGETRLGRIVGYAGDTIAFSPDGELLVNGCVASEEIFYPTAERDTQTSGHNSSTSTQKSEEAADEQSTAADSEEKENTPEEGTVSTSSEKQNEDDVYTVPENSVYILNDYRTEATTDSRNFGAVKISDLRGKIFLMLRRRGF